MGPSVAGTMLQVCKSKGWCLEAGGPQFVALATFAVAMAVTVTVQVAVCCGAGAKLRHGCRDAESGADSEWQRARASRAGSAGNVCASTTWLLF